MFNKIDRVVIIKNKVRGDLKRCKICKLNFTAFDNCMICQLIIEKESELRRKLTRDEFQKMTKGFFN